MTQRKRDGPITHKSLDRNEVVRLFGPNNQLAIRRGSSNLPGSSCLRSYDRVVKVIDSKAQMTPLVALAHSVERQTEDLEAW